jgi:hypothetical protein
MRKNKEPKKTQIVLIVLIVLIVIQRIIKMTGCTTFQTG